MDMLLARDGQHALVVEDEFLIGNYLAEQLDALGFEVEGPFPACAAALAWLASNTPDVAVLDIMLQDRSCLELARELRRRNVPILFFTGLFDWAPFHGEFAGAHVLYKPATSRALIQSLSRLLGRDVGMPVPAA